ncbi:MAG TPA: DEAD/DEAH box helicase [Chthoniobacterales bacterium]
MPTSAGKTRSVDLILRGAFYSNRTSLAMVVTPFRALCEEIRQSLFAAFSGEGINVDELSDVQQDDFDLEAFLSRRQVLVMTPEKCLYLLRHSPEVTDTLGLLIFDEGHQFDSGSRGVTNGLTPFPRPNDPGQTNKRACLA